LLFLVTFSTYGGTWGPGTTGSQFLRLCVGSRAQALAGAYVALGDDLAALFYNPAGLALAGGTQVMVTGTRLPAEISYTTACLSSHAGSWGGWACGLSYLGAESERRGVLGEDLGGFTESDLAVTGGFGGNLNNRLSVGVAGTYVRSKLADYEASTFLVDGGILWIGDRQRLGASLAHVGPGIAFISERDPPPLTATGGAATVLPWVGRGSSVECDLIFSPDLGPKAALGCEIRFPYGAKGLSESSFMLRSGYRTGTGEGGLSGFSGGLGYEHALGSVGSLSIDIVYSSYGDIGSAKQATLTLRL
jgi:hypothetical protein